MTDEFVKIDNQTKRLFCQGEWDIAHLLTIRKQLQAISCPQGEFIINGEKLTRLDTACAWLLSNWIKKCKKQGATLRLEHFSEHYQKLLSLVEKQDTSLTSLPSVKKLGFIQELGRSTIQQIQEFNRFLSFVGYLALETVRVIFRPAHIRIRAVFSVIDRAGCQALPITALLSLMIGIVIAYQMGLQLQKYGANIFVVDLLGLSVFREFGPLLTAILVAGRTGSAFTAQLGIMKINQEIDALNIMSVTPAELLLLPRMLGLFIAMPLLTIWSDFFGVIGGMIMSNNMLQITWHDFIIRFQQQIPVRALLIGIGKAPVFAMIIASIGCFQGMEVRGSAESVGTRTTRSVVLSIFFIIVVDAIFSVIFSKFKL